MIDYKDQKLTRYEFWTLWHICNFQILSAHLYNVASSRNSIIGACKLIIGDHDQTEVHGRVSLTAGKVRAEKGATV